MPRITRTLVLITAIVGLAGLAPAEAAPRATVASPWVKDDPAGDAFRPQGDLRRIVVENGQQNIKLTFRVAANPIWDTASNSRRTVMAFELDWQGTPLGYDRRVVVSHSDGGWRQVIFDANGNGICLRDGGVVILPNHGFRISVPLNTGCMGGAHVLRANGKFLDDQDPSADDDIRIDRVPNGAGYGPFIRLPN